MTKILTIALALLWGLSPRPAASQGRSLEGTWTGGFMLRGAWVGVNLRVAAAGDSAGDTADLIFPSYGGGENQINVPVENVRDGNVHFEIPARTQRIVFDGRRTQGGMNGDFVYGKDRGTFGLTRWTRLPIDSL